MLQLAKQINTIRLKMAGITQKDTHEMRNCLISIVVPSNSNRLVQVTKQKYIYPMEQLIYGKLKCENKSN